MWTFDRSWRRNVGVRKRKPEGSMPTSNPSDDPRTDRRSVSGYIFPQRPSGLSRSAICNSASFRGVYQCRGEARGLFGVPCALFLYVGTGSGEGYKDTTQGMPKRYNWLISSKTCLLLAPGGAPTPTMGIKTTEHEQPVQKNGRNIGLWR